MSIIPETDRAETLLLRIGFRHLISEANAEAGFARIQLLAGDACTDQALDAALDVCLRAGWIRDPVRLSAGALHCHWRLELTPKGVAAARASLPPTGDL